MFDTVFRPHSYPLAPTQKGFTLLELLVVMARYPTMPISVGGLVTLVPIGFVVPRFTLVFADSGRDPEGLSSLLFAWGGFINEHAGLLGIGCTATIACLAFAFSLSAVRAACARALRHFPALGECIRVDYLAHFYHTADMLLRA